MKKTLTLIIGTIFALPVFVSAATFTVDPSNGSYKTGDVVTLALSVNPEGGMVYTAMLDARFSPDIFEVVSFSQSGNMLSLNLPSYDVLDNATGILTKTGGYPGGASTTMPFGTLVLRAKGSGTGVFTVTDNSKLLDANNSDQQNGAQTVSFTITSVPSPVTHSTPQPKNNTVNNAVIVPEENKPATPTPKPSTQLALVAEFVATNNVTFLMLTVITFILGYQYVVNRRARTVASQKKDVDPQQKGK